MVSRSSGMQMLIEWRKATEGLRCMVAFVSSLVNTLLGTGF